MGGILSHPLAVEGPFQTFAEWSLDTAAATLIEYQMRQYSGTITETSLQYLTGLKQGAASEIIAAFASASASATGLPKAKSSSSIEGRVNALAFLAAVIFVSGKGVDEPEDEEVDDIGARFELLFSLFDREQVGAFCSTSSCFKRDLITDLLTTSPSCLLLEPTI